MQPRSYILWSSVQGKGSKIGAYPCRVPNIQTNRKTRCTDHPTPQRIKHIIITTHILMIFACSLKSVYRLPFYLRTNTIPRNKCYAESPFPCVSNIFYYLKFMLSVVPEANSFLNVEFSFTLKSASVFKQRPGWGMECNSIEYGCSLAKHTTIEIGENSTDNVNFPPQSKHDGIQIFIQIIFTLRVSPITIILPFILLLLTLLNSISNL